MRDRMRERPSNSARMARQFGIWAPLGNARDSYYLGLCGDGPTEWRRNGMFYGRDTVALLSHKAPL